MPKLTYYPAPNPNQTGVLLLPGGGYGYVSLEKEGINPSRWLNERGFDAWVLEYTCACAETPAPIYPAPLREALDAVREIRAKAAQGLAAGRRGKLEEQEEDDDDEGGRHPLVLNKLGIWGWSAGGHLGAVTVTDAEAHLDFGILAYPVISMEPGTTHAGSLHNLLGGPGAAASAELRRSMSAETRVTRHTPPVFLFHTGNDDAVPVQNTLLFATAMAAHGCAFEVLVLPDGPHGVGLALGDPKLTWTGELERWIGTFVVAAS